MSWRRHGLCWGLACCLLLCLTGCPSGGFFGRVIVLNTSDESLRELTLSAGLAKHHWAVTEQGQGWISPSLNVPTALVHVSWQDAAGQVHEQDVDFSQAAGYRSKDDLLLEIGPQQDVQWRLVRRKL